MVFLVSLAAVNDDITLLSQDDIRDVTGIQVENPGEKCNVQLLFLVKRK